MISLKPLRWEETEINGVIAIRTTSALHNYTIRFDDFEDAYEVRYHSHISNKSGKTYKKTIDGAIDWVEKIHYPHKMSKWLVTSNK